MKRARILIVSLALIGALPALAQSTAPTLRPEATVTGDIVRLGDLVENAGAHADVAVFRSPDLGHTGSVPAARIVDAARRAGLARISAGDVRDVSVTRAARIVPLVEMEERIAEAVARSLGVADYTRVQVSFDRGTRSIAVEPGARNDLDVQRLDHDVRSGRFEAVITIRGAERSDRGGGFRVAGIANELVEFVVPARAINRGEVIRANDVTVERRPRGELAGLSSDAVLTLTQAVGMAARRPLFPERAFRMADLMKPEVVERNGNVLITFEVPGIALTMRGKALEAGAEGDTIQVQNLQSRKTLQAVVTGPGRVAVQLRTSLPAIASAAP